MTTLIEKINNGHIESRRLGDLLSDVIDKRGITPLKLGSDWVSAGVPVMSAKNIKHYSIVNRDQIRFIDEATYKKWMPNPLKAEDVILTSEAPMGELYFVKEGELFCLGQRLFALRADTKEIYPKYLFYFLQSTRGRHELYRRISGTAAEGIRQAELVNIEVKKPDLLIQKKISEILGAYDTKVEINNSIIKNLEAAAQVIFEEWFVNFRFPGYEKTSLVESEAGKIPKGWSVKKISDVAHLNKGVSYTSAEINTENDGVALINLGNFRRGGGFNLNGTKCYTGEYKQSHEVVPGQILIAMTDLTSNREVIGHPARLPENFKKAVISLDVCSLSPKKDIYIEFLYHLMLRRSFSKLMASCASGTNVSHLSKSHIEGYDFVFPNDQVLAKFNTLIQPMFSLQAVLDEENQKLQQAREELLTKLI